MTFNLTWEDEQHSLESDYAVVVFIFHSCCMALILLGNGSVVVLFSCKKGLRTPNNLYIVSLCLADMLVAVFSIPMEILKHFINLDMTRSLCKLVGFCSYVATTSHLLCAVAIAIDRHRALVYPILRKLTFVESGRNVAVVWLASFAYGIRSGIMFDVIDEYRFLPDTVVTFKRCGILRENQRTQEILFIIDFLVMYFVPLLIIIILNIRIAAALRKADKQRPTVSTVGQRKNRVIRMLIMVVTVFAVTMFPLHLWRFYVYWGPGPFNGYWVLHHFCDISAFMNCWLNVIAYMLFNPSLRLALLPCLRAHRNVSPDTTID